jgi:hypothetical protein
MDDLSIILLAHQQQASAQFMLTMQRAALCAAQYHQLLLSSPLFLAEPRAYPTRVPRVDITTLTMTACCTSASLSQKSSASAMRWACLTPSPSIR